MMKDRIACKKLHDRCVDKAIASEIIKNGMTVAMGGYTACGYPKMIARELVRRAVEGEKFKINLVTGAQLGGEIFEIMTEADILSRVTPLLGNRKMSQQVNAGKISFIEQQMNKMPRLLHCGAFGKIDVAVVEAVAISEEGYIVPSNSVGLVPALLDSAEQIIVELNIAQPQELVGMHDIFRPGIPPHSLPIPLTRADQKVGQPFIKLDPSKIKYIVESDILDQASFTPEPDAMQGLVENILQVLMKHAQAMGSLLPVQTGFGTMTNALLAALADGPFEGIQFFCGGVVEAHLDLLLQGKAKFINTGSLQLTPRAIHLLQNEAEFFREKLIIRNTELINNAEIINRLGVTSINTGIEIDIYGNVNASHILGSRVLNGLGGGANFAQNSYLSIVALPSVSKGGDVSCIVPMVPHLDIGEHDVDILVTDCGIADLRGKDDLERAKAIINNCAHPDYKEELMLYLQEAKSKSSGHHPILLEKAFAWHQRLQETGTMKK